MSMRLEFGACWFLFFNIFTLQGDTLLYSRDSSNCVGRYVA